MSRVLVWGFGREGAAAAAWLRARGHDVVVLDDHLVAGGHTTVTSETTSDQPAQTFDLLTRAHVAASRFDLLVPSPGISPYTADFASVTERCDTVAGATELFMRKHTDRSVIVTGSKGKSTTSAALAHILDASGADVGLGGNIGTSLLRLQESHEWYVCEVSSYQAASLTTRPAFSVLTSLGEDHVDWHTSTRRYWADKLKATSDRVAAAHSATLAQVRELAGPIGQLVEFGEAGEFTADHGGIYRNGTCILPASDAAVHGVHNLHNIAGALTIASRMGALNDAGIQSCATFAGLSGRLEVIGEVGGVTFIDDTLATTVDSVSAALRSVRSERLGLILGGADRGLHYDDLLVTLAAKSPAAVALLGPAGDRLAHGLGCPTITRCSTVGEAVSALLGAGVDTVLFSPAAPSSPPYANYTERGAAFREAFVAAGGSLT